MDQSSCFDLAVLDNLRYDQNKKPILQVNYYRSEIGEIKTKNLF